MANNSQRRGVRTAILVHPLYTSAFPTIIQDMNRPIDLTITTDLYNILNVAIYLKKILVEMKLRFREFTNHYNECPAVLMEFSSTAIEIFINNVFVGNNNLLLTFFCTNCFVADISKSHSDSLTSFLLQFCLSISAAAGPRSRLSLTCRNVFICCLFCPLPACCMLCFQWNKARREK